MRLLFSDRISDNKKFSLSLTFSLPKIAETRALIMNIFVLISSFRAFHEL